MDDSGEQLLNRARALEKNLLNFFWRHGVSPSEGEDLVQEVYLRLWKYRERYQQSAQLSTFLFILARQVWLDALKRRTRREAREDRWGADQPTVREPLRGEREDVRWAVARLSEPLREVVELGVFQDLPYAQVAEILSIPVGTVKSRMSNAIRKLKEIFDEQGS